MSNKNRYIKPLDGESVSEEVKHLPMYNKDCQEFAHNTALDIVDNQYDYEPEDVRRLIKQMILLGANWQKEQYTERVERDIPLVNHVDLGVYSYTKDQDGNIRIWNAAGHLHCLYLYHMEKEVIDHIDRLNHIPPSTSTTIDELAEGFEQMAFNEGFRDDILKDIVNLMQAAYNLRDKEQAGAVGLIENSLEMCYADYHSQDAIDILTNLLAQLKKNKAMKNYTLIDPEENSNMDYQLSQTKYDKLSAYEQSLYEEAESEDDIDKEED